MTTEVGARPLRIALVAPPWFEIPPVGYGGIESMVADLADELVARGHHVTLVSAGDHNTAAQLHLKIFDKTPTEYLGKPGEIIVMAAYSAGVAKALEDMELDIVHEHSATGPLLARGRTIPTVFTAHGPVVGFHRELFANLGQTVPVVSISDSQQRLNPEVNWVGRVHNGIDFSTYKLTNKDDYVLWLGRYSWEKSPHLAIEAARKAGKRIIIAGKRSEPKEIDYFEQYVAPLLGPDVMDYGPANATEKRSLLAGAQALLMPIQWEEPFGLVMIEAMAAGTPVISFPRGAAPEIVSPSTGILVDDVDHMARAVEVIPGMFNPHLVRHEALKRFSKEAMARGYEGVYLKLVEENRLAQETEDVVASVAPVRLDPWNNY